MGTELGLQIAAVLDGGGNLKGSRLRLFMVPKCKEMSPQIERMAPATSQHWWRIRNSCESWITVGRTLSRISSATKPWSRKLD